MAKPAWRLIIREPGSASRRFDMARSEILLGRGEECDLSLSDPTISGQHARLFVRDGVLRVQDLGSTNGTFVVGSDAPGENELRSAMIADLQPGVTLTLGSTRIEVLSAPGERVTEVRPGSSSESTAIGLSLSGLGEEDGLAGDPSEEDSASQETGENALDSAAAHQLAPTSEDLETADDSQVLQAQPPPMPRAVDPLGSAPPVPAATTARIHRDVDSDALLRTTATEASATLMKRRLARLTLCGRGLQRVVDIESVPFVIGRRAEPGVDLVLRHEQVSSRHLAIEFSDGRFQVRDLNSSNGTRINSNRLQADRPHTLPPDSSLDIGPIHCLFSCLYDDDGKTVKPLEYQLAAQSLVSEGLVEPDELQEARDALQNSPRTRHLGEMLLSQPGTRLTVQRWLNALRLARESGSKNTTGWRAFVGAASGWFSRSRGEG